MLAWAHAARGAGKHGGLTSARARAWGGTSIYVRVLAAQTPRAGGADCESGLSAAPCCAMGLFWFSALTSSGTPPRTDADASGLFCALPDSISSWTASESDLLAVRVSGDARNKKQKSGLITRLSTIIDGPRTVADANNVDARGSVLCVLAGNAMQYNGRRRTGGAKPVGHCQALDSKLSGGGGLKSKALGGRCALCALSFGIVRERTRR